MQTLDTFQYLSGDAPKPEVNKEHLRIYGHPLCPFNQRTTLTFDAKELPFQYVHMDLRNKAQWHKDINGLIPVLETQSGDLIVESAVVQGFAMALNGSKGLKLFPSDGCEGDVAKATQTAKQRHTMLKFDGLLSKFWPAFVSRFADAEKMAGLKENLPQFEAMIAEGTAATGFMSGDAEPMLIDIHMFPVMERIVMLENSPWHYAFEDMQVKEKMPATYAFVHKFKAHPVLGKRAMPVAGFNKLLQEWTDNPTVKPMLSVDHL